MAFGPSPLSLDPSPGLEWVYDKASIILPMWQRGVTPKNAIRGGDPVTASGGLVWSGTGGQLGVDCSSTGYVDIDNTNMPGWSAGHRNCTGFMVAVPESGGPGPAWFLGIRTFTWDYMRMWFNGNTSNCEWRFANGNTVAGTCRAGEIATIGFTKTAQNSDGKPVHLYSNGRLVNTESTRGLWWDGSDTPEFSCPSQSDGKTYTNYTKGKAILAVLLPLYGATEVEMMQLHLRWRDLFTKPDELVSKAPAAAPAGDYSPFYYYHHRRRAS